MEVGSCDHYAVFVSVYPPINFWMAKPICMKFGMYILAPEFISTVYFINPSHQTACFYMYPLIVVRKWLGKNVTATTNTHATIE
jgi:hypothetical protein